MADLIKKIKIKKQDGTFTDYIPIGAEASNVSTEDGLSVENKLKKKSYYFDTVADMKAATYLKNGDMVITLGYYEVNDGGNGEYRIVSGTYTDDGGSYHKLNNNLFAELIIKDSVDIKQFGAKGDDNTPITNIFVKALTYAKSIGNKLYISPGTYLFNSAINITGENVYIYGNGNHCILHWIDGTENIRLASLNGALLRDFKIVSDKGIVMHVNTTNEVHNVKLQNLTVVAKSYVFLPNNNARGSNIQVENCNFKTYGDCIEINTTNVETNKMKNYHICNNILESSLYEDGSNPSTAGFPIGVAKGMNVVIDGNIINYARREAIHIEDKTENCIITNNICNNCYQDGIRLYRGTGTSQDGKPEFPPVVSGNIIHAVQKETKTNVGINIVYSTNGYYNDIVLQNNTIDGFNTGIESWGSYLNLDGTIIRDCNTALVLGSTKNVKGHLRLMNTPKLARYNADWLINFDTIEFSGGQNHFQPDNWFSISPDRIFAQATFKGLTYNETFTKDSWSTAASYHKIELLRMPDFIDADIRLFVSNGSADYGYWYGHLFYDGSAEEPELIKTTYKAQNHGVFSGLALSKDDESMLYVNPYSPNLRNATVQLDISGIMKMQTGYNEKDYTPTTSI